jgi:hypothetical protein
MRGLAARAEFGKIGVSIRCGMLGIRGSVGSRGVRWWGGVGVRLGGTSLRLFCVVVNIFDSNIDR